MIASPLQSLRTVLRFIGFAGLLASTAAQAAATVGQPAPAFTLNDIAGKPVSLADFKGRTVVLEWHNPECPFVGKHYRSGNMQGLQQKYGKQVVWLAINSTAASHVDYRSPAQLGDYLKATKASPADYLLDTDGKVGREYGAKTTPHMFVIDPKGTVVFAGGIDDRRSADAADVAGAHNYVAAALDEALAGKPVSTANAAPYGCSVKYQ